MTLGINLVSDSWQEMRIFKYSYKNLYKKKLFSYQDTWQEIKVFKKQERDAWQEEIQIYIHNKKKYDFIRRLLPRILAINGKIIIQSQEFCEENCFYKIHFKKNAVLLHYESILSMNIMNFLI